MVESDQIGYEVKGSDIQYVETNLAPGHSVLAEPGSMMFMEHGIQMQTKMGDGSKKNSGIIGSMVGLGKRAMTGEDYFLTFFENKDDENRKVAFTAPYPGQIATLKLSELGGAALCQKGSFLCAAKGTSIDVGITKKLGAAIFGGEGFILQKIQGDGVAFIHAGGSIEEKTLANGESLYVDTGSVVGFQSSVDFDIKTITGFKNILFGGEEFFFAKLTGPGKVWIQSMPYPRLLAGLMYNMAQAMKNS